MKILIHKTWNHNGYWYSEWIDADGKCWVCFDFGNTCWIKGVTRCHN